MQIIFDPDCPSSIKAWIKRKNRLSYRYFSRPKYGGSYGMYYPPAHYGQVGIKVIGQHWSFVKEHVGYKTAITIQRGELWKEALKEFRIIQLLKTSEITPRPYAIRPVKINHRYYPAIFMEHIYGIPYGDFVEPYMNEDGSWEGDECNEWMWDKIDDVFNRFNIENVDTGGNNLIVTSAKRYRITGFKVIDFTPECIIVNGT